MIERLDRSRIYLASPEAAQVTGQVMQVNGGALVGRG
jgi:hypothetical protein